MSSEPIHASVPATGVLPSQAIEKMVAAGHIRARTPILPEQIQPSSLDLRLGAEAWRVRASFLASGSSTITSKLEKYRLHTLDLTRTAVLEKGCVYIVPLLEELALPPDISAKANPKSSTGRLDIFTRLITDEGRQFELVPPGYRGRLFAEVVPRTFSVVVRQGERLSQLRLFQGDCQSSDAMLRQLEGEESLIRLPDESRGEAHIAGGLRLSVDLAGDDDHPVIGYRARQHAPLIDLSKIGHYDPEDFWDPIRRNDSRSLILDPEDFYILASRERVRIPAQYAAEMVPYDPTIGEFRIHYAGFFDPGFGYGSGEIKGTRAVLEVRSHEVPFILEDGQTVASLVFEKLLERPRLLYGEGIGSSYQRQGLNLSKHFRAK
ncbi:MAG TPA: 2'-deoxycytidine 5'-triphosphate deaminase [Bryobacteraceae bacterium]|jgi:dCTP deaminase|nr:2'-deoxycytidine 5'-triphosphate deaminase [Bryobacteraceae bacterium]